MVAAENAISGGEQAGENLKYKVSNVDTHQITLGTN